MKLVLILLSLLFTLSFKFNPMSQSLELSEGKKSAQFTIENDTAESMAIELTVKERKMDVNGKEELPATSEISIFPPQIIIPAKEKRTVRVVWNGPQEISSEKSFRVIAEQLPLNVQKKKRGTGIQMLMKYMAAFYVTPADAQAEIKVSLVEVKDKEISIKVDNTGKAHKIMYRPKLTFKKGKDKWIIEQKDLKGFSGENVLANSSRIFKLKTEKKIPADSEVSLKVEE